MKIFFLLSLISFSAHANVNMETHDFSFEYGLAYHTLRGEQKSNNSKGRLTSSKNPFGNAAYTFRFSSNYGLKLFGGLQFVQFNEPKFGTLISETKLMNHYGMELLWKTSPIAKLGVFLMHQDHPLYFADSETDFKIVRRGFYQGGLHYQLGQRRRVGILWGLGAKVFTLFPTEGGNLTTEAGGGGEAYARIGWVGPLGALYQVKGFYQLASAPNAEVTFTHEVLGYSFLVSYSF